MRRGFDETLARNLANYDAPAKLGMFILCDLEIDALAGGAAVVFGCFHLARPGEGDATGLFTLVVRKEAGGWAIVHDDTFR